MDKHGHRRCTGKHRVKHYEVGNKGLNNGTDAAQGNIITGTDAAQGNIGLNTGTDTAQGNICRVKHGHRRCTGKHRVKHWQRGNTGNWKNVFFVMTKLYATLVDLFSNRDKACLV